MFALKMFYKRLTATGFHTHHIKTFLKCFVNILSQTFLYPYFQNTYLTFTLKNLQAKMAVSNNKEF